MQDFYELLGDTYSIDLFKELGVPSFIFSSPMNLKSKSNFRKDRGSSKTWKEHKNFENNLKELVSRNIPKSWVSPDSKTNSQPNVIVVIIADSCVDTGNFSKSVLDALEGVLYGNDRAAVAVNSLLRERTNKNQHIFIAAAQVNNNLTFDKIASIQEILLSHTINHITSLNH